MRLPRHKPGRLRSPQEREVRDAVLTHLLATAAYADALPEHLLAEWAPSPGPEMTAALAQSISRAVVDAGRKEYDALLAPARVAKATEVVLQTGFDVLDPRALEWAQTHAAELVTNIAEQQRRAIRSIIETAFADQVTGPETAKRLRTVVGLSERYAKAVDNMHSLQYHRLQRAGLTREQASTMAYDAAMKYRDRLIRSRANTIARTEIMTAQNRARHLAVTQQVEDGHLSPYSRKKWVAHDPAAGISNPCRLCSALHGTTRRWDEPWDFGGQQPPRHPNCRCVQVILPPALPGDDDYLADLSSPALDRAIEESRAAWDEIGSDPAAWRVTDLEQGDGAAIRKRLWTDAGKGKDPAAYLDGHFVPTQHTFDAVAKTQRAGAITRRRSEARARLSDPHLYENVQKARRALRGAQAAVSKAAAGPEFDHATDALLKARRAAVASEKAWAGRVNAEIARAVREHRPAGAPIPHGSSRMPVFEPGGSAQPFWDLIPDQWKRSIIEIVPETETGRAWTEQGRLHLPMSSTTSDVYAHEAMHALAFDNPRLSMIAWGWLGGRVHRNKYLWNRLRIKPIATVKPGYRADEVYLVDAGIRDPYAAKVYPGFGGVAPWAPTEVMSMAVQQLLLGYYGQPGVTFDQDAVDLLVGALVSL